MSEFDFHKARELSLQRFSTLVREGGANPRHMALAPCQHRGHFGGVGGRPLPSIRPAALIHRRPAGEALSWRKNSTPGGALPTGAHRPNRRSTNSRRRDAPHQRRSYEKTTTSVHDLYLLLGHWCGDWRGETGQDLAAFTAARRVEPEPAEPVQGARADLGPLPTPSATGLSAKARAWLS